MLIMRCNNLIQNKVFELNEKIRDLNILKLVDFCKFIALELL